MQQIFAQANNNNKQAVPPVDNGNNANSVQNVNIPKITDPFGGKSLSGVGTQVINILLALIVIAAVVVIIIAGFRMIAGGSNPSEIATAKRAIIWAIIGLLVAFLSFGIVQVIQNILLK